MKQSRIIILLLPLFIIGCKPSSHFHARGNCNSLSYAFSLEGLPSEPKHVVYAVFCEGYDLKDDYDSEKGILTLALSDSKVVKLPDSKGVQYWVDKDGNATVISTGFTAQNLMDFKEKCRQPGVDLKSLDDINELIEKP